MAQLIVKIQKQYSLQLNEQEYDFLSSLLQNPIGNEMRDARIMREALWNALHPPEAAPETFR